MVLCQSCLYPILDRRQPSQRVRAMAPTGRMAHVNLSRWCAPRIFLSFYSTPRLTFFCFLVLPLDNAKLYEIYLMCYQKWACRHYKKLSSTCETQSRPKPLCLPYLSLLTHPHDTGFHPKTKENRFLNVTLALSGLVMTHFSVRLAGEGTPKTLGHFHYDLRYGALSKKNCVHVACKTRTVLLFIKNGRHVPATPCAFQMPKQNPTACRSWDRQVPTVCDLL